MKHLLVLLVCLPALCFAQSRADYDHTMSRFMRLYNQQKGDSINEMFFPAWEKSTRKRHFWSDGQCEKLLAEYGQLRSFKFIGIDTSYPEKVHVYKTIFSKAGAKTTGLTLDRHKRIASFRFDTDSKAIRQLTKNK